MSNIGKLIQAYDQEEGAVGLLKIVENLCPVDHINTVIKEYFEHNEENADLHLMRWGIERVWITFEVNI
jgi:hypothetical protein